MNNIHAKFMLSVAIVIATALFISSITITAAHAATESFLYTFNTPGTLYESGSMAGSSSPYFWLNSGGALVITGNGLGQTLQDALPWWHYWHGLYLAANSVDTDGGDRPQNLFRLITKEQWGDSVQELRFRITEQNLTGSPNRDGHNGVLLMGRYYDGNNLYYAGVRNDGQVVIKKKINGTYHTLANVQVFGVDGKYDRDSVPSLLPDDHWLNMRMQVANQADGSVLIRLFLDRYDDGNWISMLKAVDNGVGGPVLREPGYVGIRTDFMDVQFDNYRITAL